MKKYIAVRKSPIFPLPYLVCTFDTLEEALKYVNHLNKNRRDENTSYYVYSLVEEEQA